MTGNRRLSRRRSSCRSSGWSSSGCSQRRRQTLPRSERLAGRTCRRSGITPITTRSDWIRRLSWSWPRRSPRLMSAMAGGSGVPATCGLLPLRWDSRSTLPAGTMQMPCYGRLSQALHLCCNSAALSRGIFQDVSRDDIVIIVGLVDLVDGATSSLHVLHDCIRFVSPLRHFEWRALARMRGHI